MASIWTNPIIRRIESARDESVYDVRAWEQRKLKISVLIPVYDPDPILFKECVDSVWRQLYPYWELIIADDCSQSHVHQCVLSGIESEAQNVPQTVRIIRGQENLGLGGNLNRAFAEATGDYICVLDQDDLLLRNALADVAHVLLLQDESRDTQIVYTDELVIHLRGDKNWFQEPTTLPEAQPSTVVKWPFDEMMIMQGQYVNHLTVVNRNLVHEVGGWSDKVDGSQDYDLLLRCVAECKKRSESEETAKTRVQYVGHVGYVWRRNEFSFSHDNDRVTLCNVRARSAIQRFADHAKWGVDILPGRIHGSYRLRPRLSRQTAQAPMSVIIPCAGDGALLWTCLRYLLDSSTVPSLEVIVVAGPASICSDAVNRMYDEIPDSFGNLAQIKVVRHQMGPESFNFSHACNIGVYNAGAESLFFLNTDVKLERGWCSEMLGWLQRDDVGVVGMQLVDENGLVNHGGIGLQNAVPEQLFRAGDTGSYQCCFTRKVLAVTGAAMMTKRSVFLEAGGFDERYFQYFQDVALCLKVAEQGRCVIFTPYARAVHAERASFGDKHDSLILNADVERLRSEFDIDGLEETDPLSVFNNRLIVAARGATLR